MRACDWNSMPEKGLIYNSDSMENWKIIKNQNIREISRSSYFSSNSGNLAEQFGAIPILEYLDMPVDLYKVVFQSK
jgi:hypothetical protein